jgi:hypothetical protein
MSSGKAVDLDVISTSISARIQSQKMSNDMVPQQYKILQKHIQLTHF